MTVKIIIFCIGFCVGGALFYLSDKVDLLSEKKGYLVELKQAIEIVDAEKKPFSLPKGTRLKFISQYNHEGKFALEVVVTDLSLVEKIESDSIYFANPTEGPIN